MYSFPLCAMSERLFRERREKDSERAFTFFRHSFMFPSFTPRVMLRMNISQPLERLTRLMEFSQPKSFFAWFSSSLFASSSKWFNSDMVVVLIVSTYAANDYANSSPSNAHQYGNCRDGQVLVLQLFLENGYNYGNNDTIAVVLFVLILP